MATKYYKMTFIGKDGSMGFKYGKTYELSLTNQNNYIVIRCSSPAVTCPYTTVGTFLENWRPGTFQDDKYLEIPETGIGDVSDGYHTFNELYHHRAILFCVICSRFPDLCWKSKLHDTGDMFDGMFIVGINTPEGPATYHYDINPYWDMFKVPELERAPKWDGHTPEDAINRIYSLTNYSEGDVTYV